LGKIGDIRENVICSGIVYGGVIFPICALEGNRMKICRKIAEIIGIRGVDISCKRKRIEGSDRRGIFSKRSIRQIVGGIVGFNRSF
jgi:hypothetical protein